MDNFSRIPDPSDALKELALDDALRKKAVARLEESTRCLDCPKNVNELLPVGDGGFIRASFCLEGRCFLHPEEYRATVKEMGCAPWGC